MAADQRVQGVGRLRIYPLKGARGVDVERMEFDEKGPVGDRRWMVVDGSGRFVSQRRVAALARVNAALREEGLELSHARAGSALVGFPHTGEDVRVRVWTSTLMARSAGDAADGWISEALGGDYRLVFMAEGDTRATNPMYAPDSQISFADGYPVLVVTDASAREVSRRAGRDIPMERFRPNVVVESESPHEEDRWRRFTLGSALCEGVKLCARCRVTSLDQESGAADPDGEPLRTLASYRRKVGAVWFGTNVVVEPGSEVALGDPLHVVEWGEIPAPAPD